MNVARINFSHATLEEKQNVVKAVKEVRKRTWRHIAILYDTKGPEFRNGMLENGQINLIEGKKIRIVKEDVLGNEERFSVNYPQALDSLKVGDILLLENGLMKIEIISCELDGVTGIVIAGGVLGNKKSLNVPNVKLDIPFISDNDREDLIYACKNSGDFIALSFVNTKEDVMEAREIFKECGREDIKVISKIESATGFENLEDILSVSDGIMVARGDLGVEVPLQTLPFYQKTIIRKCREYGKICIVATEMLESMKKNVRPTRAEVSDIANAVLDGTDAVMLSGETTTGSHPVSVVKYMAEICENAEDFYDKSFTSRRDTSITEVIARNVVDSASMLDVKAIVVATMSGYSARMISNLRPQSLILATCPSDSVARSLSLCYGVYPKVVNVYNSTDEIVEDAKKSAVEFLNLKKNDIIVITGGFPNNTNVKKTNFMKIEEI
jgi:pyruvate kinase